MCIYNFWISNISTNLDLDVTHSRTKADDNSFPGKQGVIVFPNIVVRTNFFIWNFNTLFKIKNIEQLKSEL